jgi:hypothetical protein
MNAVTRELDEVVEHLKIEGKVSPEDMQVIIHALEQVQLGSASTTLSGPYWEARHKAVEDCRSHPRASETK